MSVVGRSTYRFTGGAGKITRILGVDTPLVAPASCVTSKVYPPLARHSIVPPQVAVDLYRLAAAVYSADLRISRAHGFDGWSREITLHCAVADAARWDAARPVVRTMLNFLTGDRWDVVFRQATVPATPVRWRRQRGRPPFIPPPRPDIDAVCLFSGGLDSAIGALDALASGRRLALASHNAKGDDAFSIRSQRAVATRLLTAFPNRLQHFQFRVDPPRTLGGSAERESSQRSRSLIFLALGVLIASAYGPGMPLVIPENGLISLNTPLTAGRRGSWSTRTTHPHTLAQFQSLLDALGLDIPLETPYRFTTKGEMLRDAADPTLARAIASVTVSCAHPNHFRFEPDPTRRRAAMPHCGTCVPCLIRRAALARVGWDTDDTYRVNILAAPAGSPTERLLHGQRGADLRAFRIALARRAHAGVRWTDLLATGPLHVSSAADAAALLRVQDAGLDEVAHMLAGERAWDP